MQKQNNSEEITLQALMLVQRVKQPDDIKVMFASLLGLIVDRPNRPAAEYLDVMAKAAQQKGILSR